MIDAATNAAPLGRVARKRVEVRKRLMLAGFELAGRRGLNEFAVADLTEAADCSKGAFYSHFESRDAFIAELIAEGVETVGEALDHHGESVSPDEALAVGLRYALTLAQQQPKWGRFVAAVARSSFHMNMGFTQRLARDLARGRLVGSFVYDDPSSALLLASGVFLAGVVGAELDALLPATPSEATRLTLIGLGVPTDRARILTEIPLPELRFRSIVVSFC
ncbi:hypothetical protein C1T17_15610 [Sphingobium sp. SCG-1]|uniref:TetR/AcrR family transcriptional regulator n=1 Tax=Sphingobium sp. SCG-1 TaxID=2072936 RepID=UPI000CD67757|nr:TetR/AcrR family transcriptional regulator [Sphingobium sp. SCG-1]AUW59302.1 hypothetical protein C1T17_15610 [Sphingobium sp. SCG-1]